MANEILQSGIVGDLGLAEVLNQEVLLLLADRAALPMHPAIVYAGDASGTGSTVIKTSELGWDGYTQLASVSEGNGPSNTALTDGSSTVSVGRFAKQYSVSDLAQISDARGMFSNPQFWAQDAVTSAAMTLTNLLAALAGGFSTTKGTTTANLTLAQYFDALSALELANVQGQYMCVLHPQQYHDLQAALRAESSTTFAFNPATVEQIAIRGGNFKGEFGGADIFTSSQIGTANAGADRAGGVWGKGAIVWADATPVAPMGSDMIIAGKTSIAFEYDGSTALSKVVTSHYLGVSEAIDAAGVSIITDA